jgi:hypothetical protein
VAQFSTVVDTFHHVAITWWKEPFRWCSTMPVAVLNNAHHESEQWRSPAPQLEPTDAGGVLGFPATVTGLAVGAKQAMHRCHPAQVDALVEEDRLNLRRRFVHEPARPQFLLNNGTLRIGQRPRLLRGPGPRRRRRPWCAGVLTVVRGTRPSHGSARVSSTDERDELSDGGVDCFSVFVSLLLVES